jgi:hypothetical protein
MTRALFSRRSRYSPPCTMPNSACGVGRRATRQRSAQRWVRSSACRQDRGRRTSRASSSL